MEYFVTILWFLTVLVAAYYADRVWSRMLGRFYWIVLSPGIAIHELSHAAACLVMFAKIRKIRLFSPTGGEVQHEKSKVPVVGQMVISMAPVVGCAAVLVLVGALLKSPIARQIERAPAPMTLSLSAGGVEAFVRDAYRTVASLAKGLWNASYRDWRTYLFIYVAICLGICVKPSIRDFRNSAIGITAIGVLIAIADFLAGKTSRPGFVVDYVLRPVQKPLHYLISFMGLVAILTFIAWFIRWLIHQMTGPRPAPLRRKPPRPQPQERQG